MGEPVEAAVRVARGGSALGGAAVASGASALRDLKGRLNTLLTAFIQAEEQHEGVTKGGKSDEEDEGEDDDDDDEAAAAAVREAKRRKIL